MSLCPEHEIRAAMTDAEFWEHVFSYRYVDEDYWDAYDPDVYVIDCARCGRLVEVEPIDREHDAFCADCANELLPYEDA